jgi:hypothetical protein
VGKPHFTWTGFTLLFIPLFVFRVLFGLSLTFTGESEPEKDALQTYLIGLKFHTTGQWPFYGPDQYLMNQDFHTQIPGALEGFLIGLPFKVLPIPEAPFLFLNLLSLSALALLANWIVRRLPTLNLYFVFVWMALLPWTLNQGTHIYNPCFLIFGSALFFLGFLEAFPPLSTGWLGPKLSFALLGFGIFWDMQFHQSWILFLPLVLLAFYQRRKEEEKGAAAEVLAFAAGGAGPLAFLVPTFVQYGFHHTPSGITHSFEFLNWDNVKAILTILARYLSLSCFEIPRFLGGGTGERFDFLNKAPWLYPPAWFLTIVGWVQPFVLLVAVFWKEFQKTREALWTYGLTLAVVQGIWFCFWFTTTGPSAHMYFIFMPLVLVFSFFVWASLKGKLWKGLAWACVIASLWFQTGFMIQSSKGRSFWASRAAAAQALEKNDYRILSERRAGSYY